MTPSDKCRKQKSGQKNNDCQIGREFGRNRVSSCTSWRQMFLTLVFVGKVCHQISPRIRIFVYLCTVAHPIHTVVSTMPVSTKLIVALVASASSASAFMTAPRALKHAGPLFSTKANPREQVGTVQNSPAAPLVAPAKFLKDFSQPMEIPQVSQMNAMLVLPLCFPTYVPVEGT
jgi:hypothetical protein